MMEEKLEENNNIKIVDNEFDAKGRIRMTEDQFKYFEFLHHILKLSKTNARQHCVVKWPGLAVANTLEKWQDWLPILEERLKNLIQTSDDENDDSVPLSDFVNSDDDEKYDHYFSRYEEDPMSRMRFEVQVLYK
jgi:hypothetical protein